MMGSRSQQGRAAVDTADWSLNPHDRVLVAGAGGFIGGHLVAELRRSARHIRAVDIKPVGSWYQRFGDVENVEGDLRDADVCRKVSAGVTDVFDLAADMGGIGFIETHKAACMLSVLVGAHLLVAARDARVERFFFASSACVYNGSKQSDSEVTALKESDAYPADPEDGYGWEKLYTERMCRHFAEDFGLQTRVARYHNVYGPLGTWDGGREKAPAAICRKVAQAQIGGSREIEIWGDGNQTRSFMYIDDCVKGSLLVNDSDVDEPLNLGSSELVSVNRLVDLVEDVAGVKLERRYKLDAPTGVRGRNSDNTKIQSRLGWQPSVPLVEGLQQTYAWIYQQVRDGREDPPLQHVKNSASL